VDRVVGPILAIMEFPIDFFFSRSLISKKIDVAKRFGPFDIERSLKVKNMQKTRKSSSQCSNQMKGDCLKNLGIKWKISTTPL
jgi:hypothetical protein